MDAKTFTQRMKWILILFAAACCLSGVSIAEDVGLGHQMLRDIGPLIGNVVYSFRGDYPFDPDRWDESNYSMIDIGQGRQNIGQCEYYGLFWTLQGNDANELTPDPNIPAGTDGPYSYRTFYSIGSEPDITIAGSPSNVDYTVLADLAAKYATTRAAYPGVPVTTELLGGPSFLAMYDDSAIQAFIDNVEPDILATGGYYFFDDANPHHSIYFERLSQWRQVAINNDLPYSMYIQTWYGSDNLRAPSESDVRFNQFTALTFGYKILRGFVYDGWGSSSAITPVLFSDPRGTNNPTALFYDVAQLNSETVTVAKSLIYLASTAVRYITDGALPNRMTAWSAGEIDPYITNITVDDPSPDDVVIGYFEPMLESDDGADFSNQQYFMITNCRHGQNLSAAATSQTIDISFDFGASGITSLQRLNRLTGQAELISAGGSYTDLTYSQTGATTYEMELTLSGGTGDLFKFYTGAYFVNGGTCAEVGGLAGDLNNDCRTNFLDFAVLAESWLLCSDPEDPTCTIDCTDPTYESYCR